METNNQEPNLLEIIEKVKDYLRYLFSRKFIILIITAVFTGIGYLYVITRKTTYTGQVTFMLYEPDKGFSSLQSILGGGNVNTGNNKDLMIELLMSRRIIESTLLTHAEVNGKTDLLLIHLANLNGMKAIWDNNPRTKDFAFKKEQPTTALQMIQDSIINPLYWIIKGAETTDVNIKSSVMTVKFTYGDEQFTKVFVETQVKSLIEFYINRKTEKSKATVKFLEDKKDSITRALQDAEARLAGWKDTNRNLIKASGAVNEARLKQDVGILSNAYIQVMNNLEVAKLTLIDDTPVVQVIDNPKYPLERSITSKKIFMLVFGIVGFFLSSIFFIGKKLFNDFAQAQTK